MFDYIFSQLLKLIFIEGKGCIIDLCRLKEPINFWTIPQHVALELRSAISDDEVTKISVAESTEEALENVIMSHWCSYRGMALTHVIGPVSGLSSWLVWSMLLVEF